MRAAIPPTKRASARMLSCDTTTPAGRRAGGRGSQLSDVGASRVSGRTGLRLDPDGSATSDSTGELTRPRGRSRTQPRAAAGGRMGPSSVTLKSAIRGRRAAVSSTVDTTTATSTDGRVEAPWAWVQRQRCISCVGGADSLGAPALPNDATVATTLLASPSCDSAISGSRHPATRTPKVSTAKNRRSARSLSRRQNTRALLGCITTQLYSRNNSVCDNGS